ncbi:MAG: hypothetical protein CR988_08005 [Treponema sp.]|nr:MAG: hypothetical protein CR988_08005 [Treponema sp.]
MECEKVINEYCKLDKHASLPFNISIHLMHCTSCRETIQKMASCYTVGSKLNNAPLKNKYILKKTMQKIKKIKNIADETPHLLKNKFSFAPWIISGIIIILAFIALPYSKLGKWLMTNLGIFFSLPFGLSCAGTVSIFCAVFILRNSDFFIKKLDL